MSRIEEIRKKYHSFDYHIDPDVAREDIEILLSELLDTQKELKGAKAIIKHLNMYIIELEERKVDD